MATHGRAAPGRNLFLDVARLAPRARLRRTPFRRFHTAGRRRPSGRPILPDDRRLANVGKVHPRCAGPGPGRRTGAACCVLPGIGDRTEGYAARRGRAYSPKSAAPLRGTTSLRLSVGRNASAVQPFHDPQPRLAPLCLSQHHPPSRPLRRADGRRFRGGAPGCSKSGWEGRVMWFTSACGWRMDDWTAVGCMPFVHQVLGYWRA